MSKSKRQATDPLRADSSTSKLKLESMLDIFTTRLSDVSNALGNDIQSDWLIRKLDDWSSKLEDVIFAAEGQVLDQGCDASQSTRIRMKIEEEDTSFVVTTCSTMAQFNNTLMLLAKEPTRYLSIRDCAILERVSHSTSAIAWKCYSVVTDLSAFGITDQMTHNAFSDLPRHCTAFFRRFDCNKLTSLRVPWNPQTIAITNGISYTDAGLLLWNCQNLVELPPIDAKFEHSIGLDDMLSGAQKRSLQSLTLYSDLSNFDRNKLLHSYRSKKRVSSTSVSRLEIAVKIPFNIDYAANTALGAFIRFINLRFDISAVKILKVFVASNFKFEDRTETLDCPLQRCTDIHLPDMFQGWTSLEELFITIEHATTLIFLPSPSLTHLRYYDINLEAFPSEINLEAFPSLRAFSIVPLHSATVPCSRYVSEFNFYDRGTLACMPVLQHLNIGSSSMYHLNNVDKGSLSVKTRKEILERTVLILSENKIQSVGISDISKEVATPEILDHIGESGCLRQLLMNKISVTSDTLLNILKRNKDLKFVSFLECDGIGDDFFTLMAQTQLRNVSRLCIHSCSPAGIIRYIRWRIRQIEKRRALAHLHLLCGSECTVATLFPNMNPEEVCEKGRITLDY